MKQTASMEIEMDRPAVVALFEDRSRYGDWQAPFLGEEPLEGTPGEAKARCELKYTSGTKELVVTETVIENSLPDRYRAQYVGLWGSADVMHRFQALSDGRTRWVVDVDFRGKGILGLIMRFMPGILRGLIQQMLLGFKTYAESQMHGGPGPKPSLRR